MKRSIKVLLWVAAINLLLVYTIQFFAYRNERAMREAVSPVLNRAMAEGVESVRVEGTIDTQQKDMFTDYLEKPFLFLDIYGNKQAIPEMEYSEGELVVRINPEAKVLWHNHKVEE